MSRCLPRGPPELPLSILLHGSRVGMAATSGGLPEGGFSTVGRSRYLQTALDTVFSVSHHLLGNTSGSARPIRPRQ